MQQSYLVKIWPDSFWWFESQISIFLQEIAELWLGIWHLTVTFTNLVVFNKKKISAFKRNLLYNWIKASSSMMKAAEVCYYALRWRGIMIHYLPAFNRTFQFVKQWSNTSAISDGYLSWNMYLLPEIPGSSNSTVKWWGQAVWLCQI